MSILPSRIRNARLSHLPRGLLRVIPYFGLYGRGGECLGFLAFSLRSSQVKGHFYCELGKMRGTAVVGVDGMWGRGMRATEGGGDEGGTRNTHGFRSEPLLVILRAHFRSSEL